MTYRELYEKAQDMINKAYAPFSKFKVGAALLSKDGRVFTGVNVENSSLGGTICAERTAFVKAISEGVREFQAIAVVSGEGAVWPCGICRQVLNEFSAADMRVIVGRAGGPFDVALLSELLPRSFGPNALSQEEGEGGA